MVNERQVDAAWWRGAVLYQVYPLSFCDSNGDGFGDLPGLTSKLDYIASLGVDGIWISPFFPSPMKDFGYDVSDYRGVDPRFGTLDDFDRMIAQAHALGLKVIIDQVWSHSSDAHPWFRNSRTSLNAPNSDWYIWADAKADGTPPNNWLSVFGGGAWTWEPRRRQYYLHHFLPSQPQLNLRNEKVLAALFEAATFWLDRGGEGLITWAFSNHDVVRAVTRWGAGAERTSFARLLMALLLSLRGSVCVYQGEELGLPEPELDFEDLRDPYGIAFWPEFRGRDGARTPMPWQENAPHAGFTSANRPWLPVPPAHHALAVDRQERSAAALLHSWRRFLR